MKIAFATNYYNHHQKPLADALYALVGDEYHFIETEPMSEERLQMGWGREEKPSYVLQSYTDETARKNCQKILDTADVVILGNAPYSLIKERLKNHRITFLYTERLYKTGVPFLKLPIHFLRNIKRYNRFRRLYALCASAYTPIDFARTLSFIRKTYQWGYFTEVKQYADIDAMIEWKRPASILWVARFIEWKHPEIAIEIANRLKADGYDFQLNMIGNGILEDPMKELVKQKDLSDCVALLGAMKPEQVRERMEKSEIFLFTSDRNEGWGAVLNESMNSGCAVVANSAIGAAPFLIEQGENGYLYQDGNLDDLYEKVKLLLDNTDDRKRIAKNAYQTMVCEWNAENAARKLLELCRRIQNGENRPFPYKSGVCSEAKRLKDRWLK